MSKLFLSFFLFSLCWINFSNEAYAAKVDTLEITSTAMQKKIKAAVVLPASYNKSKNSYPVLYLLHGGSGNFRAWFTKTPDKMLVHRMADQYNIIIVAPDGGETSYYFDSPLDKSSQYETFISKELVQEIDKRFRTIKDRKGRVIAGNSMGGHGAVFLSVRHPDTYCAAASMSGVMNINTATWKVPPEFRKLRADNFAKLLGPPKDEQNLYSAYTAVGLVDQIKTSNVKLSLECGVDDFLIDTNRELHRLLLENKTPHDYTERPGTHTWEYWENALPYQFIFLSKVLKENSVLIP